MGFQRVDDTFGIPLLAFVNINPDIFINKPYIDRIAFLRYNVIVYRCVCRIFCLI